MAHQVFPHGQDFSGCNITARDDQAHNLRQGEGRQIAPEAAACVLAAKFMKLDPLEEAVHMMMMFIHSGIHSAQKPGVKQLLTSISGTGKLPRRWKAHGFLE